MLETKNYTSDTDHTELLQWLYHFYLQVQAPMNICFCSNYIKISPFL